MIGIVGTGGFAQEIAWHLETARVLDSDGNNLLALEIFFVSENPESPNTLRSYTVVTDEFFLKSKEIDQSYFLVAIGEMTRRSLVTENLLGRKMLPCSLISDYSRVGYSVKLGRGFIICPNVTIMPNVQIGDYFQAHINSYIAHNCVVGNFVTLLPGAMVSGNVHIGDRVLVGAGAIIRNGSAQKPLKIGSDSIIGMGSVVTKSVPEGTVVVGNPAKVISSSIRQI